MKNICSLSLLASLSLFPVIVRAQQSTETGLITIESDQQTADNSIGVVTAQGNVRLIHIDRGIVATGRQAQYFIKEESIVLSGDVDIVQKNGDLLQADRIVYSLVESVPWRHLLRMNKSLVNGVSVLTQMIQPR